MCGIVGYVGKEERCVEVLMEGLRHPEYRSYDSAGLELQMPRPHRVDVPVLELVACRAQAKPGHDGAAGDGGAREEGS